MSTQQGQAPYYFVPGPSKWPVLMGTALLLTMAGASGWVNGSNHRGFLALIMHGILS